MNRRMRARAAALGQEGNELVTEMMAAGALNDREARSLARQIGAK